MRRSIVIAPMLRFDVSQAESFGKVAYLFDSSDHVSAMSGQAAFEKIMNALLDCKYDENLDAIVMTGQVALVAMTFAAASALSESGHVRVLLFDARSGQYRPHLIDTSYLPEEAQ